MSTFESCLSRWESAEQVAWDAERALGPILDRYCEGLGPAPSAQAIAEAKELRQAADVALKQLFDCLLQARLRLPLL